MRYLGLGLMITTPLPFAFLFWDDLYDDDRCKYNKIVFFFNFSE